MDIDREMSRMRDQLFKRGKDGDHFVGGPQGGITNTVGKEGKSMGRSASTGACAPVFSRPLRTPHLSSRSYVAGPSGGIGRVRGPGPRGAMANFIVSSKGGAGFVSGRGHEARFAAGSEGGIGAYGYNGKLNMFVQSMAGRRDEKEFHNLSSTQHHQVASDGPVALGDPQARHEE